MFSLACNLTKNDVRFLPVKISSKKYVQVEFLTRETTSKKVRGSNLDHSTSEIKTKELRGNNVVFSVIEITPKKLRGNDMDFSISKITSKKYVEMTWKFVKIWFSTYQHNIHVVSTSIRRGVPIEFHYAVHKSAKHVMPFIKPSLVFV